jgi:hypothetical protein
VDWLRRKGRVTAPAAAAPAEPVPEPAERAAPGVAEFFDRVAEDRSHAILDLGPASDASLRLYSRFARWIRFADLLSGGGAGDGAASLQSTLPAHPERPYDLIFGWDVLDRTRPEERRALVERLTEISAPNARLYIVVEGSAKATIHPLRFSLLDTGRMRYEVVGPARPAWPPLLPSEVERLLAPFQVSKAFTSAVGLREYVAVRRVGRPTRS